MGLLGLAGVLTACGSAAATGARVPASPSPPVAAPPFTVAAVHGACLDDGSIHVALQVRAGAQTVRTLRFRATFVDHSQPTSLGQDTEYAAGGLGGEAGSGPLLAHTLSPPVDLSVVPNGTYFGDTLLVHLAWSTHDFGHWHPLRTVRFTC